MGLFDKFKKVFAKKEEHKEDVEVYEKGLEKTRKEFVNELSVLGHKYTKVSDEYFDELESILIMADIGVNTVMDFIDRLKARVKKENIKKLILNTKKPMDILQSIRIPTMGSFFMFAFQN